MSIGHGWSIGAICKCNLCGLSIRRMELPYKSAIVAISGREDLVFESRWDNYIPACLDGDVGRLETVREVISGDKSGGNNLE